ncbi:hypothetical protein DFQ27_002129 [Actinomortierella ambigua]|uniref:Uncharacterized protein n=1 Tax=Actinomortierella ambigua TaxID=1343610 RepID=A0A9P6Q8F3_9FUNG|nr:hypothetical protein DFQ27_002129 [Actinomortierella ambigua]
MATTFATLGESAPTTRPVVHKAAYFSLDQDTLCSIPCGCPTHVDPSILAPLPPRRRPAIKTTLPSNTVSPPPPAKRRVDPSSPLQPQLAHKRTRTSRSGRN